MQAHLETRLDFFFFLCYLVIVNSQSHRYRRTYGIETRVEIWDFKLPAHVIYLYLSEVLKHNFNYNYSFLR